MKAPIAEPKGGATFPDAPRTFRVRFWRAFGASLHISVPLSVLLFLYSDTSRFSASLKVEALLATSGGGALAGALVCLLVSVEVSRDGLRTADTWGVPRLVRWEEMQGVKRRWVIWSYLIVSGSRKKLWIPLQLHPFDEFVACVQSVAPADNPLRLELEQRQKR